MHRTDNQRFQFVPSLPMFMIETKRNRSKPIVEMNTSFGSDQQSTEAGTSYSQSASVLNTSSRLNYDQPIKPERRHMNKTRFSKSEIMPSTDEVLVHCGKQRKPAHKPRRKHKTYSFDVGQADDEVTTEFTMTGSISDERESTRNSNIHSERQSSTSRKSLMKEVIRLRQQNDELTKRLGLQQSEVSQDSGYQPTGTNNTVGNKEEYVDKLLEKLTEFEQEYRVLEKERNQYKNLLTAAEKQQSTDDHQETIASLQSQNRELAEDVLMLKNLVYRLNLELEKYQSRLRKYGDNALIPTIKSSTGSPENVGLHENEIQVDRGALGPLLEAYDETINEKEDLIQNYEKDLSDFVGKCKDVVAENERLQQEMIDFKKKNEATKTRFNLIHGDASITQEQNELMAKELELQKEKFLEIHSVYREKISELAKKHDELVSSGHRHRAELLVLQGSYAVLRDEHDKLRRDAETKVPYGVHSAAVSECRRLLDELKRKYKLETEHLTARLEQMLVERPEMEERAVTFKAEISRLEMHVKTFEKLLKKTQRKYEDAQGRWVTTKVSKDAVKRQLQKAIAFAEELIQEQEQLLKQLHAKQEETDSMAKIGSSLVNRMGTLKTKLKDVQKGAWQELDVIEKRISQQESGVGKMKEEYNRETLRLQNLVGQKEAIIMRLQKEKSKTEDNLEVVWKAATADGVKFNESSLKKSNLRQDDSYSQDMF